MVRNSARLSHQTRKNYGEQVDGKLEFDSVATKYSSAKKRKAALDDDVDGSSAAADTKPKTKRRRRTKGRLQAMLGMPLDVVYEIFSHLEPLDLLHLARTSKQLRNVLMDRSSAVVWKVARSNVRPALPDCPEDLNEPQYAHLMFCTGCHFCGRKVRGISIIWTARFRICLSCGWEKFERKTSWWEKSYSSTPLAELFQFLPTIPNLPDRNTIGPHPGYYINVEKEWKTHYQNATDKSQWLRRMVEERRKIEEHAAACEAWHNRVLAEQEEEHDSVIKSRQSIVLDYVRELGWGDELSKMSQSGTRIEYQAEVMKICKRSITQESLASLYGFVKTFMTDARDRRIVRERDSKYRQCLGILDGIMKAYVATLPDMSPHPTNSDVFNHPSVKRIIENTPDTEDFTAGFLEPIIPLLPEIHRQWQDNARNQLISMIREAAPEYSFDEETVFDLATTAFHCNHDQNSSSHYPDHIRFPEILMHECTRSDYFSMPNDFPSGSAEYYLRRFFNDIRWNHRGNTCFDLIQMRILTAVVKMCGLDPSTTTGDQMDELDPIFECILCNGWQGGRATMRWWGVPIHYRCDHKYRSKDKLKLVILNEKDAAKARVGMADAEQKRLSDVFMGNVICRHCAHKGSYHSTLQHIYTSHGISYATMDDVGYFSRPYYYPQNTFYLWPPRLSGIPEPSAVVVRVNESISPQPAETASSQTSEQQSHASDV